LDNLLVYVGGDSAFKSLVNLTQSFLALENDMYDLCLTKINDSYKFLPASEDETEPYNSLISVFLEKVKYKRNPFLISILEKLLRQRPNGRDSYDTLVILGNYYDKLGESEKALINYQKAVSKKPNTQEIWDKIFELEINF